MNSYFIGPYSVQKRKSVPSGTRNRTIYCAFNGVWGWPQQAASRRVMTHALLANLQCVATLALLAGFVSNLVNGILFCYQ